MDCLWLIDQQCSICVQFRKISCIFICQCTRGCQTCRKKSSYVKIFACPAGIYKRGIIERQVCPNENDEDIGTNSNRVKGFSSENITYFDGMKAMNIFGHASYRSGIDLRISLSSEVVAVIRFSKLGWEQFLINVLKMTTSISSRNFAGHKTLLYVTKTDKNERHMMASRFRVVLELNISAHPTDLISAI